MHRLHPKYFLVFHGFACSYQMSSGYLWKLTDNKSPQFSSTLLSILLLTHLKYVNLYTWFWRLSLDIFKNTSLIIFNILLIFIADRNTLAFWSNPIISRILNCSCRIWGLIPSVPVVIGTIVLLIFTDFPCKNHGKFQLILINLFLFTLISTGTKTIHGETLSYNVSDTSMFWKICLL